MTISHETSLSDVRQTCKATCPCHEYRMSKRCRYLEAVSLNTSNRLRIGTIAKIHNTESNLFRRLDEHNAFRIGLHEKDDVVVWHVILRRSLSQWFRTSSVVLVDSRRSCSSKALLRRVQCFLCSGKAGTQMLWMHESKVSSVIKEHYEDHRTSFQMDEYEENNHDDVVHDTSTLSEEVYVSFLSSFFQGAFPCPSDES